MSKEKEKHSEAAQSADPKDEELAKLRSELAAAKADAEAARVEADAAKADAAGARKLLDEAARELKHRPASYAERGIVALAKTTIRHNGIEILPGQPLPFDPRNPPPGCDGLIEGLHYTLV